MNICPGGGLVNIIGSKEESGSYSFSDLVDVKALQELMDKFYAATGIPCGIIGRDGMILVKVGWQEICTRFHRMNPVSRRRCIECDRYIASHLGKKRDFVEYKCRNGLIDIGIPIIVEDNYLATMFFGQFLYEEPDLNDFKIRALEIGVDVDDYLEAIKKVPVFTRQQVLQIVEYYVKLAGFLTDMGLKSLNYQRSQRKVEENEHWLRQIIDTIPYGMFVRDEMGNYLVVNKGVEQIYGMPVEDIQGKNARDVMDLGSKVIEECLAQDRKVFESGNPLYIPQKEFTYPDGTFHVLEITRTPFNAAELPAVLSVGIDITKRKEFEEELKKSQKDLMVRNMISRAFLLSSDDSVYKEIFEVIIEAMDSKYGVFGYVNSEGNLICASMNKEIWDMCNVADKSLIFPPETWIGMWDQLLNQRLTYCNNNESDFNLPAGHIPIQRALGVPITFRNRVLGLVIVANRSSDYKAEDKSKLGEIAGFIAPLLNARLEGFRLDLKRKRAEKSLREYAVELERSNNIKDLFTDIMRHDLLNPASIVKGFVDILVKNEDDAEKHRMLETIQRNNDRLIEMIRNAAKLSRLSCAEHLELNVTDISPFLKECIKNFLPIADDKGIDIDLVEHKNCIACLNPIIEDVFANFLSNAIKYSPQGSKVTVAIEDMGKQWKIMFTDEGPGVPDKDKELIFDRFEQLGENMTFSGVKGSGLGLAISKRIMQMHKGNIGVEDNPEGQGSVFWITLDKSE